MDSLPNELLNNVSGNLELDDYIALVEANPRSFDVLLFKQIMDKIRNVRNISNMEIIEYDTQNEYGEYHNVEYSTGAIKIEISEQLYEGEVEDRVFHLIFHELVTNNVIFNVTLSFLDVTFIIVEDALLMMEDEFELKLTNIELDLLELFVNDYAPLYEVDPKMYNHRQKVFQY